MLNVNDGRVGGIIVNTLLLGVAFGHPLGLVLVDGAVGLVFYFEKPLCPYGLAPWWSQDKLWCRRA